ncbi:MAG: putative membrane protein YecN with MAPEG domain [Paraglaciecola sp.]|jgi:uncharacterized membrane protein YecN with MAPEG domain
MQDFYWFIILVAANSVILLLFTINVSRLRLKYEISWGDGGNKNLMKAIRLHSNGTEQVPIYILIILSLVFIGSSNILLAPLVVVFTLSRLIHAHGLLYNSPISRKVGAAITYASQGAAVISLLVSIIT